MKKHSMPLNLLSISLAALILCSTSIGQKEEQSIYGYAVKGSVTSLSPKKALRSAWVIFSQGGKEITRALTGDDGKYYIKSLRIGIYDVSVERDRRRLCTRQVDFSAMAYYVEEGSKIYGVNLSIKSLKLRKSRPPLCGWPSSYDVK